MRKDRVVRVETLRGGAVAGLAGGFAEIAFIMTMAVVTGTSAANVARGVSESVGVVALSPSHLVLVGLFVHMGLAVALGVAVAMACQRLAGRLPYAVHVYAVVPAALTGVWAINFFVLLPLINPDFVQLVPYPVSFLSKLLFGVAAAESLRRTARNFKPEGVQR